jgi:hypothetical protein
MAPRQGNGVQGDLNAHECVGDVGLGQFGWAMAGVRVFESLQKALESRPKLDGIGSLQHSGIVDFQERVVDNGMGALVVLGDNNSGRDTQVWEVTDQLVWQYQTLTSIDHVDKLGAHEFDVHWAAGAPVDRRIERTDVAVCGSNDGSARQDWL